MCAQMFPLCPGVVHMSWYVSWAPAFLTTTCGTSPTLHGHILKLPRVKSLILSPEVKHHCTKQLFSMAVRGMEMETTGSIRMISHVLDCGVISMRTRRPLYDYRDLVHVWSV